MEQHPNAKLTPKGRETLVSRIESGLGVAEAARQMGNQPPDRRQVAAQEQVRRGALRPKQPPDVEERVCEARSSMLLASLGLAATTGVPARPGHPRALRAGGARRAPARRRQESGPHTRRRRPPRLGARLRLRAGRGRGLPARRRRRLQQGRLRRAAARRAQGHLRGVHGPVPMLLRGHGRAGRARDDRQRPWLPQRRVQRAARIRGRPPCLHEGLQPLAERQGRAHEPHAGPGMAVRQGVGRRGGQGFRPARLHRTL